MEVAWRCGFRTRREERGRGAPQAGLRGSVGAGRGPLGHASVLEALQWFLLGPGIGDSWQETHKRELYLVKAADGTEGDLDVVWVYHIHRDDLRVQVL